MPSHLAMAPLQTYYSIDVDNYQANKYTASMETVRDKEYFEKARSISLNSKVGRAVSRILRWQGKYNDKVYLYLTDERNDKILLYFFRKLNLKIKVSDKLLNDGCPIISSIVEDDECKMLDWLENGCNAYEKEFPISRPLSLWTGKDVVRYIKLKRIK